MKTTHQCLMVSGNAALESLLREGFVLPEDEENGLVILVRGKPGTGKTTFAMQVLQLLQRNTPRTRDSRPNLHRVLISVEQSTEELQHKLARMLVHQAIEKSRYPELDGEDEYLVCSVSKLNEWFAARGIIRAGERLFKRVHKNALRLKVTGRHPGEDQQRRRQVVDEVVGAITKDHRNALQIYLQIRTLSELTGSDSDVVPPHTAVPFGQGQDSLTQLKGLLMSDEGLSDATLPRSKRPVAVIDGLSTLSREEQRMLGLRSLVNQLRARTQLAIIVYEPLDDHADLLSHQVDMVIELAERTLSQSITYLVHELWIKKSRYQPAALGTHQFKMRNSGVEIYPSIHFQVHRQNYPVYEYYRSLSPVRSGGSQEQSHAETSSRSASVLDMILGTVQPGNSVALFGARGTFKRELCRDFLIRGSWGCPHHRGAKPQAGLLISLLDNAVHAHLSPTCPVALQKEIGSSSVPPANQCPYGYRCIDAAKRSSSKPVFEHIFAFHQRPGCITPAEFMHYVKERITRKLKVRGREQEIQRVVFWDLTQIDYRFPLLKDDRMFLPAMLDLFNRRGIASVIMGAGNASYTAAVSAMADNAVFCWRDGPECRPGMAASQGSRSGGVVPPRQSLLLYVDRKASPDRKEEKLLYEIDVTNGLMAVPATAREFDRACRSKRDIWDPKSQTAMQIAGITRLQGL